MAVPARNTAGHWRLPQRHMAATARPEGKSISGSRPPMRGTRYPSTPAAKIIANAISDLCSDGLIILDSPRNPSGQGPR